MNVFNLIMFWNIIYSCDAMLNFQHHYSSLQCHMIPQKSFWFAAQIIVNVENSSAAYFCGNSETLFFPGLNIYWLFIF